MTQRPFHILLVEDLEAHRFLIQKAIERYKGSVNCIVHPVASGEEAMQYLRREGRHKDSPRPSLILLDISMPGRSGFDVLREIKADRELMKIPTVMLTSSQQDEDVQKSYALGSSGYIAKAEGINGMNRRLTQVIEYWTEASMSPEEEPSEYSLLGPAVHLKEVTDLLELLRLTKDGQGVVVLPDGREMAKREFNRRLLQAHNANFEQVIGGKGGAASVVRSLLLAKTEREEGLLTDTERLILAMRSTMEWQAKAIETMTKRDLGLD